MQTLIPLLIILLLHSAFTAERERGTLRLLASLGVPAQRLAWGKALGASAVMSVLLIPASLIGAAAITLSAGAGCASDNLARTLILALCYLIYFSLFVCASLIVSARAKTSQMALIVLLAGWFLNCFVAPRVTTDLAGRWRPAPSAMQLTASIERDLEQGIDGHSSRGARIEELKARTLAWLLLVVVLPSAINAVASTLYPVPSRVEYIQAMREASETESAERNRLMAAFYEDHPELARGSLTRRDEFTLTKEQLNQRMETLLRPVAERFDAQLARQQRFVNWFRFLTPALLAQEAFNDIAGTGQARHQHFFAQVDAFHAAWKEFFFPRIARRELVSCGDFALIPRYEFREEQISDVARRLTAPLLGIGLLTSLIGVASLAGYRRYRIS